MSVVIISVGTSLFENSRKTFTNKGLLDTLHNWLDNRTVQEVKDCRLEKALEWQDCDSFAINPPPDFSSEYVKHYFDAAQIQTHIDNRPRGKDYLPAEISSLFLYYFNPDGSLRDEFSSRLAANTENGSFVEKDQIYLVTTDTPAAVYCARLIELMIQLVNKFSGKCEVVEIKPIENLDVFSPENWTSSSNGGLMNLYEYFRKELAPESEGHDKVLIRTGGYKEMSADLKLIAIHYSFRSLYLFERSWQFVEVPGMGWPEGGLETIIHDTGPRN